MITLRYDMFRSTETPGRPPSFVIKAKVVTVSTAINNIIINNQSFAIVYENNKKLHSYQE